MSIDSRIFFASLVLCLTFCQNASGKFPQIVGTSAGFVGNVTAALQLIESKAPEVLQFINTYTGKIQEFEKSGMCVWCTPPTYQLAFVPGNMEKYWLASTISHDTYHSYLYKYYKAAIGGAEPDYNLYSGFDAERKCNAYQMAVLKRIGAPQNMIDYMATLDGKHCDLNGDGVCDDKDYALRNYRK